MTSKWRLVSSNAAAAAFSSTCAIVEAFGMAMVRPSRMAQASRIGATLAWRSSAASPPAPAPGRRRWPIRTGGAPRAPASSARARSRTSASSTVRSTPSPTRPEARPGPRSGGTADAGRAARAGIGTRRARRTPSRRQAPPTHDACLSSGEMEMTILPRAWWVPAAASACGACSSG